MYPTKYSVI